MSMHEVELALSIFALVLSLIGCIRSNFEDLNAAGIALLSLVLILLLAA